MDKLREFINANPRYGFLIAAVALVIFLIGILLDADWVLEPGGGYFNTAYFIEKFGRKTVRLYFGIMLIIGILSFLGLFFYY